MYIAAVICNIVTATTCLGFVTGIEQYDRIENLGGRLLYFRSLCFGHGTSSVEYARLPLTPHCSISIMTGIDDKNKLELSLDENKHELSLDYLTGCDLEKRIADTADNDRSLVRFDRQTKQLFFPKCDNCEAPKIIHRDYEFKKCARSPTKVSIEKMLDELKQVKGIEKFGVIEGHDDIEKLVGATKRRRSMELTEELPEGKRIDDRNTPSKVQQNENEKCRIKYDLSNDIDCQ